MLIYRYSFKTLLRHPALDATTPTSLTDNDRDVTTTIYIATLAEEVPDYASHSESVEPPPYAAEGAPSRTRPQQISGYARPENKVVERPFSSLTDIKIVPESYLKPLIASFDPSRAVVYSFRQVKGILSQVIKAFDISALQLTSQASNKEFQIRANIAMTTREALVMLHHSGQKEPFASLVPSSVRKVVNPATTSGQIIPPPDPTAKYSFAFLDSKYQFSVADVPMRVEHDATFHSDGLKRSTIWAWAMGDRWFRWAKWLPLGKVEGTGPVADTIRQGGTRLDVAVVDGIGDIVRSLPFEKACTGKESDLWMPLAIWKRSAKAMRGNDIGHVEWILSGNISTPSLPGDLAAAHLLASVSNSDQGPARWERFVLALLATLAYVKAPHDPKRDPSVAGAFVANLSMGT